MTPERFLEISVTLGFVAVFIAVGLAVYRIARGPSLPDRVVALDAMTVAGILILLGGVSLAAGPGVLRLPDVYIRMHAATKVGTLASDLMLAGCAVAFRDPSVLLRCAVIVIFVMMTAPIAAHMIGRAALRIGIRPWGIADAEARAGVQVAPDQQKR